MYNSKYTKIFQHIGDILDIKGRFLVDYGIDNIINDLSCIRDDITEDIMEEPKPKQKFNAGDKVVEIGSNRTTGTWTVRMIVTHFDGERISYRYECSLYDTTKWFAETEIKLMENEMKTYQCERNTKVANEARAFVNIIRNLNNVVDKAGGSGWSLEQLEGMTAADLLCTLSTNSIGFKYTGKN